MKNKKHGLVPDKKGEAVKGKSGGRESRLSMFFQVFSVAFLVVSIIFCLNVVTQVATTGFVRIGGYSLFRVITGSMEPTIPTGAILISRETPIESIELGDIVCYKARVNEIYGAVITHRVVYVGRDDRGIYLETRGDANVVSDGSYIREENLVGRVVWHSGEESVMADIAAFFSGQIGFFACVVFPTLLVVGLLLQNAVKNLDKELREVRIQMDQEHVRQKEEEPMPGYRFLTRKDYDEIYETLKQEFMEVQRGE